ncbi:MAG: hypothetical protein GX444_09850 [Myxococcales bacterium]|nr:hypothetical protein [Myxococcales bacterium]
MPSPITEQDRARAKQCMECPVCSRARTMQKGLAYWFVKTIEGGLCPMCKAYEKVYGRKAHEPLSTSGSARM